MPHDELDFYTHGRLKEMMAASMNGEGSPASSPAPKAELADNAPVAVALSLPISVRLKDGLLAQEYRLRLKRPKIVLYNILI